MCATKNGACLWLGGAPPRPPALFSGAKKESGGSEGQPQRRTDLSIRLHAVQWQCRRDCWNSMTQVDNGPALISREGPQQGALELFLFYFELSLRSPGALLEAPTSPNESRCKSSSRDPLGDSQRTSHPRPTEARIRTGVRKRSPTQLMALRVPCNVSVYIVDLASEPMPKSTKL